MFGANIDIRKLPVFKELADTVKVILYLRRQDDYAESFYTQYVKDPSSILTFDEFLVQPKTENRLDYSGLCVKWTTLFGAESLIVRPFELQQLHGGTVFSDFLSIFDLEFDDSFVIPEKRLNESLHRNEIEFLLLLNRLSIPPHIKDGVRNFFLCHPSNIDEVKYSFWSTEKRRALMSRCVADSHHVAKVYLHRPDGVLFINPSSDEFPEYPGLTEEVIALLSAHIATRDPQLADAVVDAIKDLESKFVFQLRLGLDRKRQAERRSAAS